jgi:hypothetical protein
MSRPGIRPDHQIIVVGIDAGSLNLFGETIRFFYNPGQMMDDFDSQSIFLNFSTT